MINRRGICEDRRAYNTIAWLKIKPWKTRKDTGRQFNTQFGRREGDFARYKQRRDK